MIGLLLNMFIWSNTWMIWPRPGFIGHVRITQVIISVVLMVGFLESYLSFANVYNILRGKRTRYYWTGT